MSVTFKQLKAVLDKMSPEQLKGQLYVNREDMGVSGSVVKIRKASANLIYDDSDDPSFLRTRKQLLSDGYDKEDIDGMSIEIPKGSYYLEF